MLSMTLNLDRIRDFSQALAIMGIDFILNFEYRRYSYQILRKIYDMKPNPRVFLLLGTIFALAFRHYSNEEETKLWDKLLYSCEETKSLSNLEELYKVIDRFGEQLTDPHIRDLFIGEKEAFFTTGFCDWFIKDYENIVTNPLKISTKVRYILGSKLPDSSIVNILRIMDLTYLVIHDEFLMIHEGIVFPVSQPTKFFVSCSQIIDDVSSDEKIIDALSRISIRVTTILDKTISIFAIADLVDDLGKMLITCSSTNNPVDQFKSLISEITNIADWKVNRLVNFALICFSNES